MPEFPSLPFKHPGTKLIAILLALVVYAHVYTEREQDAEFNAPLRLNGLSPELVLRNTVPTEVRVTVRAKGKQIWKLRVRPPEVVLDLGLARSGEVHRMLSPADVVFPVGTEATAEAVQAPRMVVLDIDSLVTRQVPVTVRLAGTLPEDSAWDGTWSVTPAVVAVSGPRRDVTALDSVATHPIPLGSLRDSSVRRVPLAVDHPDLQVFPDTVRVELPVVALVRKSLGRIPVHYSAPPAGYFVRVMPDSATLLVSGPRDVVQDLRPSSVTVSLDIRGLAPGLHRVAPQFSLPHEKLEVRALMPSEFLVEVGRSNP